MQYENLKPDRVFYYFKKISEIPHGSGNTSAIADFCEDFAKTHNLKCLRDAVNNIIIFKDGTVGYEQSEPIILQGHLDMVCQKTPDCDIDFERDGLNIYVDGDFIKARGTTLGADNGIAVAMVLAILESNDISHPPIEAVFTIDEETGMIGALAIDTSVLLGTRMINLDSETEGNITVSCAGGSDFEAFLPISTQIAYGQKITVDIGGLKGGHSGVEINQNRINANMLAGRILNELDKKVRFDIISINGGDKANAIPNRCIVEICAENANEVTLALQSIYGDIKTEISDCENDFSLTTTVVKAKEYACFNNDTKSKLICTLLCAPNGITEMSASIKGLVQTSLNLGILKTENENIILHFALRSNKLSALRFLEKRLIAFFEMLDAPHKVFGLYPAWEYRENSPLRDMCCRSYYELSENNARVMAIHAGLECGVFASKIKDFDCVSMGPSMHDVHTTRERLSISSTERFYTMLLKILEKLK